MNLLEYREFIRSLSEEMDGNPVLNASMDHATIIVERLFATADNKVDILSGSFNPRVYGREEVVTEAKLFLASSPDREMRVLVERGTPQEREYNPFFVECASLPNLKLRKAPDALQHTYGFHFVVADASSYRFEEDKASPSAVAAFGDKDRAQNLANIFQTLWDQSEEVPVLPPPSQ